MPTSAVRVHLGRDVRRLVLLVHLSCSLGWLGADVVLGVLAVTAFTSDDPTLVAACYTALHTFAVPVLLTLGLGSLGSGLLLGLASRWGVVRTRWVLVKLMINVVLVGLVPVLLQRGWRRPRARPVRSARGWPSGSDGSRWTCCSPRSCPAPHCWSPRCSASGSRGARRADTRGRPRPRTHEEYGAAGCLNQTCTRRDSNP